MMRFFFIILLFLFSFSLFGQNKQEEDEKPRPDYYYQDYEAMDETFEKAVGNENQKQQEKDLKPRNKKIFYFPSSN